MKPTPSDLHHAPDATGAPAEPSAAPAQEKHITRHRMRAHRSVSVQPTSADGLPQSGAPAYAVHRIDVAGHCAYLHNASLNHREFNATQVRPAAALPAWCGLLGLRRHPALLIHSSQRIAPQPVALAQSLDRRWLVGYAVLLLLLTALAWWHMPLYARAADVLTSRYAVAALALTLTLAWRIASRHLGRVQADLSGLSPEQILPLRTPPPGLKAGIASANLGDRALQVIQGRALRVTHWERPIAAHGKRPPGRIRGYRFELDGRSFEGQTTCQSGVAQPFIVEGDLLRVAIENSPATPTRVLALANLTDGHVVMDETDPRIQTANPALATPAAMLTLLVPAFALVWLGVGPGADSLSAVIFGVCLALGLWTAAAAWLRRELRAGLLRALGADIRDLPRRSVDAAPGLTRHRA